MYCELILGNESTKTEAFLEELLVLLFRYKDLFNEYSPIASIIVNKD